MNNELAASLTGGGEFVLRMMKRISSARIEPSPHAVKMFGPMPTVYVKFEGDEEEHTLFTYYPDELSFSVSEFIGLTEAEARQLLHKKDVAYLRS
jgi:hypothetical protein